MKKHKVYFGRKHLTHHEGRYGGRYVVPRMFHRYFELRRKLARWATLLKLATNSQHGAVGHNMAVASEQFTEILNYRARIGKTLRMGLGVRRMAALCDEIETYHDGQNQTTVVMVSPTASYVEMTRTSAKPTEGFLAKEPNALELYPDMPKLYNNSNDKASSE